MDKDLLIYHMKRAGKTRPELAQALGISKKTLDNKLSGRSEFTAPEIKRTANYFELNPAEIFEIFFAG